MGLLHDGTLTILPFAMKPVLSGRPQALHALAIVPSLDHLQCLTGRSHFLSGELLEMRPRREQNLPNDAGGATAVRRRGVVLMIDVTIDLDERLLALRQVLLGGALRVAFVVQRRRHQSPNFLRTLESHSISGLPSWPARSASASAEL